MKKGIPKIKIPIRQSELTIEAVEPYIDSIFSQFESNAIAIRKDYDTYCLDHPIHTKVRAHQDTDINNIVLVPDLKAMVDWKTGYVYGNPIKYAQTSSVPIPQTVAPSSRALSFIILAVIISLSSPFRFICQASKPSCGYEAAYQICPPYNRPSSQAYLHRL